MALECSFPVLAPCPRPTEIVVACRNPQQAGADSLMQTAWSYQITALGQTLHIHRISITSSDKNSEILKLPPNSPPCPFLSKFFFFSSANYVRLRQISCSEWFWWLLLLNAKQLSTSIHFLVLVFDWCKINWSINFFCTFSDIFYPEKELHGMWHICVRVFPS